MESEVFRPPCWITPAICLSLVFCVVLNNVRFCAICKRSTFHFNSSFHPPFLLFLIIIMFLRSPHLWCPFHPCCYFIWPNRNIASLAFISGDTFATSTFHIHLQQPGHCLKGLLSQGYFGSLLHLQYSLHFHSTFRCNLLFHLSHCFPRTQILLVTQHFACTIFSLVNHIPLYIVKSNADWVIFLYFPVIIHSMSIPPSTWFQRKLKK